MKKNDSGNPHTPEILIREAVTADAGSLSSLNDDVQRMHARAHPHLFKSPGDDAFAVEYLRKALADESTAVYIASIQGEDIGYVNARIVDQPQNPFMKATKCIYIGQISVRPGHRRKGVATKLIEAVKSLAASEKIDTITLDTWAFNEDARRFFESQGFSPCLTRMWKRRDASHEE